MAFFSKAASEWENESRVYNVSNLEGPYKAICGDFQVADQVPVVGIGDNSRERGMLSARDVRGELVMGKTPHCGLLGCKEHALRVTMGLASYTLPPSSFLLCSSSVTELVGKAVYRGQTRDRGHELYILD